MNRTTLFAYLRRSPFGGRLTTAQVRGVEIILKVWEATGLTDLRFLAYILATAFHETAATMLPVRETLAPNDAKAIAILDRAFAAGRLSQVKSPYWRLDKDGKSWLGRGFVQLTHRKNYERATRLVGVDLVANPVLAMDIEIAARILVEGMIAGLFTGRKLDDFFNVMDDDPEGARRIINGTDKAKLIASHYTAILGALKAASQDAAPVDALPALAMPDDKPAGQSVSAYLAGGGTIASGIIAPLLGGMDNLYSLLFGLALLTIGGVVVGMFASGRWSINRGAA